MKNTEDNQSKDLKYDYYKSLLNVIKDPAFVVNINGEIVDVNAAALNLSQLNRDDLLETIFFDYFENQETCKELFFNVINQKSEQNEPVIFCGNKQQRTLLFNGTGYTGKKNEILGCIVILEEIHEKKNSIENLLNFFDSKADAVVIVNKIGLIKFVNLQAVKLFGYQKSQLIDSKLEKLIPSRFKNSHISHREHFSQFPINRHMGSDSHYYALHASGKEIPVDISLTHFETIEGQFVSAAVRDVSRIIEASEYARTLLEASLDPLVTINSDGKITDLNEASVIITGIDRDDLLGTDFSNYFTEPDKANQAYQKVFEIGFVADYPLTIKNKNGQLAHVLYNASLYKDHFGKVLGVFASARDITKQKQSLHYARSLIEATLDPLITININGKITDINDAMIKATDKSREQIIGTDFQSYFIESEKANEVFKDVFKYGKVQNFPLTIIDGVLTDVLINGSIYQDVLGTVVGAVFVARDISELKRIEKELTHSNTLSELATFHAEEAKLIAEKSTEMAKNAVKSKQQFLSNMSHEIRTPMNVIIGFTKVLLKTELSLKQKEYLTAIKLSGDALIVLINDILDLAKVDAGKMTFEQIPFSLKHSITSMLQLFEAKIFEKNLILEKKYDDLIPDVLLGDSVRLHQVIINLLSNAVKFTSKGKIALGIKLLSEDERIVKIEFSVKDTGVGIAENNLSKIFDNFQQAYTDTSRLFGGTGLGLAIVKQLIESQGGSIFVKSKLGKGSTFSFILSFYKTDKLAAQDENFAEPIPNILIINVLVVEDIALNQLLMKTILDDFGFERDIAENGLIAIEKLQKKTYDIILMDLQMPEMNGFETTEFIRNTMGSDIPIIALTADVTTMDIEKCKAVGMNDYLAKPLNEKLLYSKIIALLKKTKALTSKENYQNDLFVEAITKCTNLDYIKKLTKSDNKLMSEMINLYLDQTPELIQIMNQSFVSKNWKLLYDAIHKLIPSFKIMGMGAEIEKVAKNVQDFASLSFSDKGMPEMILQIDNCCNQACIELRLDLIEMKKNEK